MIVDHSFQGLSNRFIYSTGPQPCSVLLIGESGGEHEDDEGKAFCGLTGRELDRFYLPIAALRRHEVRVTNLVPFHPLSNRNPTKEEIKYCEPFLLDEIELTNPDIVVPMGFFATRYFLGDVDLHTVHGLLHTSNRFQERKILPTYHPAAGLHNTETQALIAYDFQQLQLALMGELPDRPRDTFKDPLYVELVTAMEVYYSLQGCAALFMGMDTEGYAGNPWGLSYSINDGVAYVIRAASKEALAELNKWLSRNKVTVILHNAMHDLPILRELGVSVQAFEDTMVYAYSLCLEPQGLKDLAYRHCGMRMKSYEDVTGPAMRKLTAEYLKEIAAGNWGLDPKVPLRDSDQTIKYRQPQALHKRAMSAVNDIFGVYSGTIIGCKRGGSVLLKEIGVRVGKVDKASVLELKLPKDFNAWHCKVPIPIKPRLDELYGEYIFELKEPVKPEDPPDAIKRWEAMQEDLEESILRMETAIGTLPETGLDAIEDQQVAVDYSARDAHATLGIRHKLRQKVDANGLPALVDLDIAVLPYIDLMRTTGIKVNRKHMLDYGEQLKIEMRLIQEKLHHDLGVWINPSSSQQVAMVIYDMLGFPVEVRTEHDAPSTNDKVLEALSPLHDSIKDITDFRELHKLRNTYAVRLPRWTDELGRCHPTWKYTRVHSGRLSTANPNLLGIPTRTDRGKVIRAGFVPEPGFVFIGCDLSQIEVRVAAHYSKDPNLIEIFTTPGADFHVKTASFMWKISEAEVKADHVAKGGASKRSSAKNVSFGVLYGIGSKGLRAQLKSKCHTDWTEEQCQEMIDLWLEIAYPGVKLYMERQKHFCRQYGYVESMYGRRRYLPGVNSTIPRIREEAYRALINHPIQASASEILKVAIRNIWSRVLPHFWKRGSKLRPVLSVHDELVFECEILLAIELQAAVIYEMENAVAICVPVIADGHISKAGEDGGSWADLK